MHLYPFKFEPILKEKIWGGSKIKEMLRRGQFDEKPIGETWELSTIESNESIVSNGEYKGQSLMELLNSAPREILGSDIFSKYGKNFPLLIKYIDANKDLSVQVHPNDKIAERKHGSKGKTESWYILQSDGGSKIYYDLKKGVRKDDFIKAIDDDNTIDLINEINVTVGDFFHIPAGTVHTIGKGNLILEIQQASDITYRIFDFNRKDDEGKSRELHLDDALEAVNFEKSIIDQAEIESANELIDNAYYKIAKLDLEKQDKNFENNNQLKIIISVKGKGVIISPNENMTEIDYSDVILIPAGLSEFTISTEEHLELLLVSLN
jgi:mannose-6-phosphate isomerase